MCTGGCKEGKGCEAANRETVNGDTEHWVALWPATVCLPSPLYSWLRLASRHTEWPPFSSEVNDSPPVSLLGKSACLGKDEHVSMWPPSKLRESPSLLSVTGNSPPPGPHFTVKVNQKNGSYSVLSGIHTAETTPVDPPPLISVSAMSVSLVTCVECLLCSQCHWMGC